MVDAVNIVKNEAEGAKKLGRPTDYREKYCAELIEMRAKGISIEEICYSWGIVQDTFHKWRYAHKVFADAYIRANQAYKGWFQSKIRGGIEEHGTTRTNERLLKFLGYVNFGISEKSTDALMKLPPKYYAKETTLDEKQQILDIYLASEQISTAVYESLSKTITLAFERQNGLAILEASDNLKAEKDKAIKASE